MLPLEVCKTLPPRTPLPMPKRAKAEVVKATAEEKGIIRHVLIAGVQIIPQIRALVALEGLDGHRLLKERRVERATRAMVAGEESPCHQSYLTCLGGSTPIRRHHPHRQVTEEAKARGGSEE